MSSFSCIRGRQSGSTCKMGWQEKTGETWDENGWCAERWGKGEESLKLRSRSEPDLEGFKPAKSIGFFLEGSKRTPVIFSRDWVHI